MRIEQDICGNIRSLEVERQGCRLNNQMAPDSGAKVKRKRPEFGDRSAGGLKTVHTSDPRRSGADVCHEGGAAYPPPVPLPACGEGGEK